MALPSISELVSLDGKCAIVTGAAQGFGAAISRRLGEAGATVFVADRNVEGAEQSAEGLRALGYDAIAHSLDITDRTTVETLVDAAEARAGRVDILVNNAGILRDRTIFNLVEEDWDAVLDVHLKGHYCCSRPFARYIRETNRPGCRIINFSSVSGLYGNFGQSNYAAAKAGIAGLSRVLALELAKYGCTVNTISPGATTRMTAELRASRGMQIDENAPEQSPNQIAPVCAWLASEAGQDMTAQIIDVMRGWIGIMQQPKVIRKFSKDGMWNNREIDLVMPQLLKARQEHDAAVDAKAEPTPVA